MQPSSVVMTGRATAGGPSADAAAPGAGAPPSSSWPAALRGRVANTVALLVTVWVAVGTVLFIHRYALNILYYDQWLDAILVHHALHGSLTLSDLWAQHNENRILVPNLIVVALGATTHLDVLVEDYLSGGALWGAIMLLVAAHRRRSPDTPWLAYCPVIVLLSSYMVASDVLFGFNLSWFLVLLALSVAVYLADRPTGRVALAGAVAAAAVGSYSSAPGPADLARRPGPALAPPAWGLAAVAVWIASGVVTTVVFFVGYDFNWTRGGRLGHATA